jgi:hypothetical protein
VGELPGGYWDTNGQLHRAFELAALNGRDEEHLAAATGQQPATLVTELLSRCVRRIGDISPVSPEVARQLLVADRHYLLLLLRQVTFGDRVTAHLFCPWPDCGERMSVDFSIADLPVEQARHRAPVHTMTLAAAGDDGPPIDVTFRLPNGADQEEVSGLLASNEAAALTLLLSRCIERIGPHESPDEQRISALSAAARSEIEQRMEELAPKVGQAMDTTCAECGRPFTAPFDIHRFFFGELRTDDDVLYHEVHYLAYHYHWSEREIMQLTRDKRQKYIEVLADAIEVLNSGA